MFPLCRRMADPLPSHTSRDVFEYNLRTVWFVHRFTDYRIRESRRGWQGCLDFESRTTTCPSVDPNPSTSMATPCSEHRLERLSHSSRRRLGRSLPHSHVWNATGTSAAKRLEYGTHREISHRIRVLLNDRRHICVYRELSEWCSSNVLFRVHSRTSGYTYRFLVELVKFDNPRHMTTKESRLNLCRK